LSVAIYGLLLLTEIVPYPASSDEGHARTKILAASKSDVFAIVANGGA
jgi:hypothetical protein